MGADRLTPSDRRAQEMIRELVASGRRSRRAYKPKIQYNQRLQFWECTDAEGSYVGYGDTPVEAFRMFEAVYGRVIQPDALEMKRRLSYRDAVVPTGDETEPPARVDAHRSLRKLYSAGHRMSTEEWEPVSTANDLARQRIDRLRVRLHAPPGTEDAELQRAEYNRSIEKQNADSDAIMKLVGGGKFDTYEQAEHAVVTFYVPDLSYSRAGISHALSRLRREFDQG